jgi:DNA-binding CsgD family transcriptional regulator
MKAQVATISPRQRELLQLLGNRMTLGEAANAMGITKKTANTHKCQLMFRLGLRSRRELLEFAANMGSE